MRMIERVMRSMRDTGLLDGMSDEDVDTLATAALEGMMAPTDFMISEGGDTPIGTHYCGKYGANAVWKSMIDAALNE